MLDPALSRWLWYSSWMFLGTAIMAYAHGQMHLYIGPAAVWVTSILYWWNPVEGWRRTLDRVVAATAISWHALCALTHPRGLLHIIMMGSGIIMYYIGWSVYNMGDHRASVAYHFALHLLSNLSNIVLYR